MNTLNFSNNVVKLRREKRITQEELATFIGVTKASVSKWETGQSLPDVLLLPELAAYFDITIDELLGYELRLSKEQIEKIYSDFATGFVTQPFEEVMVESQELVKKYYSCYPFLFRMACLWLNHFMLAGTAERQMEILNEISKLCCHITEDCSEIRTCNDAVCLKAIVDLQMGKPQEVIEALEKVLNPYSFSGQNEAVLTQAYQIVGETQKANAFTQVNMFLHLLSLVGHGIQYLAIHAETFAVCEKTIYRTKSLIEIYDLEQLHPNVAAQFWYQSALVYSMHGKKKEALENLNHYIICVETIIFDEGAILHGDVYFDALDSWFADNGINIHAPREKKVIMDSARQALEHPAFARLHTEPEYIRIKKELEEKGGLL